jgi:hypothetical protein
LALRAALIAEIGKAFPGWKFGDDTSYETLAASMLYLVNEGSRKSAALAVSYYRLFRQIEMPGASTMPEIVPVGPPPIEQIRTALRVTSQVAVAKSLGAGMSVEQAMGNALVQASGSMSRLALNTGRETVMSAVRGDPAAYGWSRDGSGHTCAFCSMLISRGPVYKAETVAFKAHDHCACFPVVAWSPDDWTESGRKMQDLWHQTGSLDTFRAAIKERAAATAA